jgi:rSAM/selenodomain-associated transferase 2
MTLSIIIPALNEEDALPATLANLAQLDPQPYEIILVDGGSADQTVQLAKAAGVRVIHGQPTGRASQMNEGAAGARGDQFCFLHADTLLPADFVTLTKDTLADKQVALAGFVSIMRGQKLRWLTTAHNYIKTWYAPLLFRPLGFLRGTRLLFGDQAMVCRREDFTAINGFDPKQVIMEEADLCQRMVRAGRGRVRQVNRKVWSSDRRVASWGPLKANLTYLYVGAMWGFGIAPKHLARKYEDVR